MVFRYDPIEQQEPYKALGSGSDPEEFYKGAERSGGTATRGSFQKTGKGCVVGCGSPETCKMACK